MPQNYYVILGISASATPHEVRRAYRQKVLELHPDHHGPDASPFLEVQKAYAVLSDPGQRRSYDESLRPSRMRVGEQRAHAERIKPHRPPAEPLIPRRSTPVEDISLTGSFQTFNPSFEEIFDRFWSNFTGEVRPKGEKIENLLIDVPVTLEQAIRGGRARVLVPARLTCRACRGRGGIGPYECWRCGGAGAVTGEYPVAVPFPAGMPNSHAVMVSLESLGVRNLYLTVRFRIVSDFP